MKISLLMSTMFCSIVFAKLAHVEVSLPDGEKKTYEFFESNESKTINIGIEEVVCAVSVEPNEPYVEVSCGALTPSIKEKKKGTSNFVRIYNVAPCGPKDTQALFIDSGPITGKSKKASLIFRCDK